MPHNGEEMIRRALRRLLMAGYPLQPAAAGCAFDPHAGIGLRRPVALQRQDHHPRLILDTVSTLHQQGLDSGIGQRCNADRGFETGLAIQFFNVIEQLRRHPRTGNHRRSGIGAAGIAMGEAHHPALHQERADSGPDIDEPLLAAPHGFHIHRC